MAMIVDGYNVLHASRWLGSEWKGVDRAEFCRLLGSLARHSGERIIVVFDALPSQPDVGRAKATDLEVIYSGHGRTADEAIIKMINVSSGPRDLTVVSSDREIKAAARRRGCKVRAAGEFIKASARQLARARSKQNSEPTQKQKGLTRTETDQWLSEFGIDPHQEEDPYERLDRGHLPHS